MSYSAQPALIARVTGCPVDVVVSGRVIGHAAPVYLVRGFYYTVMRGKKPPTFLDLNWQLIAVEDWHFIYAVEAPMIMHVKVQSVLVESIRHPSGQDAERRVTLPVPPWLDGEERCIDVNRTYKGGSAGGKVKATTQTKKNS